MHQEVKDERRSDPDRPSALLICETPEKKKETMNGYHNPYFCNSIKKGYRRDWREVSLDDPWQWPRLMKRKEGALRRGRGFGEDLSDRTHRGRGVSWEREI